MYSYIKYLANKKLNSNSIYAGNKLHLIKENVFWDGKCVHKWTSANTKKYMVEPSDKYIYKKNKTNNFIIIEETLNKLTSAEKKLEYMLTKMNQENKNRFSIY